MAQPCVPRVEQWFSIRLMSTMSRSRGRESGSVVITSKKSIFSDAQVRNLNAELRHRIGALKKREVELAEREAKLVERVLRRQVRKHESELRRRKAELADPPDGDPLTHWP